MTSSKGNSFPQTSSKMLLLFVMMAVWTNQQVIVQLDESVTNAVTPRQNIIYKIQSCSDTEIEITVKGSILVEAGPARVMSLKGYQSDIKQEINDRTTVLSVNFPFVYQNSYNKHCMIFLSIYGQLTNSTVESAIFTFKARPKVINDIEIVEIEEIKESGVVYQSLLPSKQDKIFFLDGDVLQNQLLNIQVFDNIPSGLTQEEDGTISQQIGKISLPHLIFNDEGKSFDNKKKKKKSSKNKQNSDYTLKAKSSYLNFNLHQQVVSKENQVIFLVENHNVDSEIRIFSSDISYFQPFENLTPYKLSGLNFVLKMSEKQKIIFNNEGNFVLDIFSQNLDNIEYSVKLQNHSEFKLKALNSYTKQVILKGVVATDSIEIVSNEDLTVLLELKPFSSELQDELTKERDEFFQLTNNNLSMNIKSDLNDKIELAYIFISNNSTSLKNNVIVGESTQDIIYFKQIDHNNQDIEPILRNMGNFTSLFFAVRAYDQNKRSYVSNVIQIENPYSHYEGFTIIHFLITVAIALAVSTVIYLFLKYRKGIKIDHSSDEAELIHSAVHMRMPSESV